MTHHPTTITSSSSTTCSTIIIRDIIAIMWWNKCAVHGGDNGGCFRLCRSLSGVDGQSRGRRVNFLVSPQILGLAKSYITVLAFESLFAGVRALMLRQVGFVAKAGFAQRALERLFARVRALVTPQVGLFAEAVAAEGTLIRFLEFGVGAFVHPQIVRFTESEIAVKTLERPSVQIGSLFAPRVAIQAGRGCVAFVSLLVDL